MDILNMLGQAAGLVPAPQGTPGYAPEDDAPITVQGEPMPFELARRPEIVRRGGAPKRKAKNIIQDVLGALGDGILLSNGRDEVYSPWKKERAVAEAMEVMNSPEGKEIGERLLWDADPVFAQDYFQQKAEAEYKTLNAQALNEYRGSQTRDNLIQEVGQVGGSVIANPSSWPRARVYLQERLNRLGIPIELPEEYTPAVAEQLRAISQSGYQQARTEQTETDLDSKVGRRAAQTAQGETGLGIRQLQANIAAERARMAAERLAFDREREEWKRQNPTAGRQRQPRGDSVAPARAAKPAAKPSTSAATGGNRKLLPDGRIAVYKGTGDRKDSRNWTITGTPRTQ
jgi:hypothetical protein